MKKIILFITYCLVVLLLCVSNTFAEDSTKVKKNQSWALVGLGSLSLNSSLTQTLDLNRFQNTGLTVLGGSGTLFISKHINNRWVAQLGTKIAVRGGLSDYLNDPNWENIKKSGYGVWYYQRNTHYYMEFVPRILFNILSKENYKFYASAGILMGNLFHWKRVLKFKNFYPIETEPIEIITFSTAPRFSFGTTLGLGTQFKIRSLWHGIIELNQELSFSRLGIGIDWQSRNFAVGFAKLIKSQ